MTDSVDNEKKSRRRLNQKERDAAVIYAAVAGPEAAAKRFGVSLKTMRELLRHGGKPAPRDTGRKPGRPSNSSLVQDAVDERLSQVLPKTEAIIRDPLKDPPPAPALPLPLDQQSQTITVDVQTARLFQNIINEMNRLIPLVAQDKGARAAFATLGKVHASISEVLLAVEVLGFSLAVADESDDVPTTGETASEA